MKGIVIKPLNQRYLESTEYRIFNTNNLSWRQISTTKMKKESDSLQEGLRKDTNLPIKKKWLAVFSGALSGSLSAGSIGAIAGGLPGMAIGSVVGAIFGAIFILLMVINADQDHAE
jgi:hypothetical protein